VARHVLALVGELDHAARAGAVGARGHGDEIVPSDGCTGVTHHAVTPSDTFLVTMASGPDAPARAAWSSSPRGRVRGEPQDANHAYEIVGEARVQPHAGVELGAAEDVHEPDEQWDPKDFSNSVTVWDLKARKIVQELKGDPVPLATRWR